MPAGPRSRKCSEYLVGTKPRDRSENVCGSTAKRCQDRHSEAFKSFVSRLRTKPGPAFQPPSHYRPLCTDQELHSGLDQFPVAGRLDLAQLVSGDLGEQVLHLAKNRGATIGVAQQREVEIAVIVYMPEKRAIEMKQTLLGRQDSAGIGAGNRPQATDIVAQKSILAPEMRIKGRTRHLGAFQQSIDRDAPITAARHQ